MLGTLHGWCTWRVTATGEGWIYLESATSIASVFEEIDRCAKKNRQEVLDQQKSRSQAIAAAKEQQEQQEVEQEQARLDALKKYKEQAKIEAQRRVEAKKAKEVQERKAREAAEQEELRKKQAENESRSALIKHRNEKLQALEANASKMEDTSEKLKAAEPKIYDTSRYADMFQGVSKAAEVKHSKIWLALNPQPIAFQTVQDKRERAEDVVDLGLLSGNRFSAMKNIMMQSPSVADVAEQAEVSQWHTCKPWSIQRHAVDCSARCEYSVFAIMLLPKAF